MGSAEYHVKFPQWTTLVMDQFGTKFSLGSASLFWSGLFADIFALKPSFFLAGVYCQQQEICPDRLHQRVISMQRRASFPVHAAPNSNLCHMLCNLPSPLKIKIIKDYCNPGQLVNASQCGSCLSSNKREKCPPISLFSNFYFLSRALLNHRTLTTT